jgi:hypothetical protein
MDVLNAIAAVPVDGEAPRDKLTVTRQTVKKQ